MIAKRLTLVGPFWPYRGGIAHFMHALEASLEKRECSVQTVTFSRQYPDILFPGQTQYSYSPQPERPAERLLDTLNPITWVRSANAILATRPEVVIFAYWHPFLAPALGVLARRLRSRGVLVVCIVHNAFPHERRRADRLLTRFALKYCSGLLVMSDSVREDVISLKLDVPLRHAPHPVYDSFGEGIMPVEARLALGLDPDRPTLLFFGFIRPYKGLHVLLEAMRYVVERIPNAILLVAGEFYADEKELRTRAELLGHAVRFVSDYIPDDQVAHYFCAANVVVQPYVSATQSGVAQIAYHFGRPVITTDIGGLAEIVPHGVSGLVVPPENPQALAAAIVRFFAEGMEATLSEGVKQEREKYSWDRLIEAIQELTGALGTLG